MVRETQFVFKVHNFVLERFKLWFNHRGLRRIFAWKMLRCLRFCLAHTCPIHKLRVCRSLIPIPRKFLFFRLLLFFIFTINRWFGFLDPLKVVSRDFAVSCHYKSLIVGIPFLKIGHLGMLIEVVIKVRLFCKDVHAGCKLACTTHQLGQVFDFLLRSFQDSLGCICASIR